MTTAGARTHYDTLNVSRHASGAAIRAAYLALVRLSHPDVNVDDREAAERRTRALNAAFAVLGDPERRAAYDKLLEAQTAPETSPAVRVHRTARRIKAAAQGRKAWIRQTRKEAFLMFWAGLAFLTFGVAGAAAVLDPDLIDGMTRNFDRLSRDVAARLPW